MTNRIRTTDRRYREKCAAEEFIFSQIQSGSRIFVGSGCGEPQYLVKALVDYEESRPEILPGAKLFEVCTLGVSPYTIDRFTPRFRHCTFFVADPTRRAINSGNADYVPALLSEIPGLFSKGIVPLDVALIQTSLPDSSGYLSLGISVDIVKAAVENALLVIAQTNSYMPRVQGNGFVHLVDVDFVIPHDEPLLEYLPTVYDEIPDQIGKQVASLIHDGDTIQIGYGSIANSIIARLREKKHLGVHSELLSDGIADLMSEGVIDNSQKSIDRGRTVASFCMGTRKTYKFIDNNPAIELRTADYVNNPLVIAQQENMVAINCALEIDLTGQATADSIGKCFYSGIGGHADFMRGAVLARNGRSILILQSTARNESISRIVPQLQQGAGVTLNRGDIRYVVTEYGIANLHGKSIHERAKELIPIAHPKFRQWLFDEANKDHLIGQDDPIAPSHAGESRIDLVEKRINSESCT